MGNSISSFDYEDTLLKPTNEKFSVEVEGGEDNLSPIYAHPKHAQVLDIPKDIEGKDLNNVYDMFLAGKLVAGPNSPIFYTRTYKVQEGEYERTEAQKSALGKKYKPSGYIERVDGSVERFEYKADSYQRIQDCSEAIGRSLIKIGVKEKDNVGIFAINRTEWLMTSFGLYSQNMRVVPFYATLGPDVIEYINNHAECPAVFVSKENFASLAKTFPVTKQFLKHVIVFDYFGEEYGYGNSLDTITDEQKAACEEHGIELHSFNSFIANGMTDEAKEIPLNVAKIDDLAFVMYTSGTTGAPKGVMLSHYNLVNAASGASSHIDPFKHQYFSYLPLAHVFETVAQSIAWLNGGAVYFSQGDPRYIVNDLQTAKPTFMPGVPRIFVRFYQSIMANVDKNGWFKRTLIYRALNVQANALRTGQPMSDWYDEKIFSVMREKIGFENINVVVNGAAPIPGYLCEFLRIVCGPKCFVAQGYGLTESCAATAANVFEDKGSFNVIGVPFGNAWMRLSSEPELGFNVDAEHPAGELLIHSNSTFVGYYKNEEMTKETYLVDSKGRKWLKTGDVARRNMNGTLSVVSRVKSLCKLAQGEYVALEKVEDTYSKSALVNQFFLYGNSYKPIVVAVVIPNPMPLYEYANEMGWWNKAVKAPGATLDESTLEQFTKLQKENYNEIKSWLMTSLKQQEAELLGFEKIKDIYVDLDYDPTGIVFTEARDLITPTLKKKRQQLTEYYLTELKAMYSGLGEPEQTGEKW